MVPLGNAQCIELQNRHIAPTVPARVEKAFNARLIDPEEHAPVQLDQPVFRTKTVVKAIRQRLHR